MANMGPVPKREAERRRGNKTAYNGESTATQKVDATAAPPVTAPEPVSGWHAIARAQWDSAQGSVVSQFYEGTDWTWLQFGCEAMSRALKPVPIVVTDAEGNQAVQMHEMPVKGADITALQRVFASLMFTEGDRRRLRMEIEREAAVRHLPDIADLKAARAARRHG